MEETMVMNAVEETTMVVPQEATPDNYTEATATEKTSKGGKVALLAGGTAAVAAMGGIAFGLVKHFRKKKQTEEPEKVVDTQADEVVNKMGEMSAEQLHRIAEAAAIMEEAKRKATAIISEQPEKATEEKTDDEPDNPEKTDDEPEQNNQEDQQQENTEPATKPKKKGR